MKPTHSQPTTNPRARAFRRVGLLAVTVASVAALFATVPKASAGPPPLTPVNLELGLVMDTSGSINTTEYGLQVQAYANAFMNPTIQAFLGTGIGSVVTVIQFDSSSKLAIPSTHLTSIADVATFATTLANMPRIGSGGTNIDAGVVGATAEITGNMWDGIREVIDVSTDGQGTATGTARDAALAAGVNTINAIGIGGGANIDQLRDNIIGGDGAFVAEAADFVAFNEAIFLKIFREVTGTAFTPPPLVNQGAINSTLMYGVPTAAAISQITANLPKVRDLNSRLFRARLRAAAGQLADARQYREPVYAATPGANPGSQGPIYEVPNYNNRMEIFGHYDYGTLDLDNVSGTVGAVLDSHAGTFGVEYSLNDNVTVGTAFSYIEAETDLSMSIASVESDGFLFSPYITFFGENFYADFLYGYGTFNNDIRRATGLGTVAMGDPNSQTHSFELNVGGSFETQSGFITGPFAGLEYTAGSTDFYRETGAGAANLVVGEQQVDSFLARFGWQVSKPMDTRVGRITPQVRLSWDYLTIDNQGPDSGIALATSPFAAGTPFVVSGTSGTSSAGFLNFGAGFLYELSDSCALVADYEGHFFANDYSQHFINLRISKSF